MSAMHTAIPPKFLQDQLLDRLSEITAETRRFADGMHGKPLLALPSLPALKKANSLYSCDYCQSISESLSNCKNCGAPRKRKS